MGGDGFEQGETDVKKDGGVRFQAFRLELLQVGLAVSIAPPTRHYQLDGER